MICSGLRQWRKDSPHCVGVQPAVELFGFRHVKQMMLLGTQSLKTHLNPGAFASTGDVGHLQQIRLLPFANIPEFQAWARRAVSSQGCAVGLSGFQLEVINQMGPFGCFSMQGDLSKQYCLRPSAFSSSNGVSSEGRGPVASSEPPGMVSFTDGTALTWGVSSCSSWLHGLPRNQPARLAHDAQGQDAAAHEESSMGRLKMKTLIRVTACLANLSYCWICKASDEAWRHSRRDAGLLPI